MGSKKFSQGGYRFRPPPPKKTSGGAIGSQHVHEHDVDDDTNNDIYKGNDNEMILTFDRKAQKTLASAANLRGRTTEPEARTLKEARDRPFVAATGFGLQAPSSSHSKLLRLTAILSCLILCPSPSFILILFNVLFFWLRVLGFRMITGSAFQ